MSSGEIGSRSAGGGFPGRRLQAVTARAVPRGPRAPSRSCRARGPHAARG
jgi:hypothetical protein